MKKNAKARRRELFVFSGEVGEFGFFGDVGGAFEVEMVAVGVEDVGVPEAVADEGFLRIEAAGLEFTIKRDGVVALEPDGRAEA